MKSEGLAASQACVGIAALSWLNAVECLVNPHDKAYLLQLRARELSCLARTQLA